MVDIDDYRVEDNRKDVLFRLDLTGFIDDLIRERLEIILEEGKEMATEKFNEKGGWR